MKQDLVIKAAVILGALGGVSGYLTDTGVMALLPAKYAASIGIICGACGTLAALLHPSPLPSTSAK